MSRIVDAGEVCSLNGIFQHAQKNGLDSLACEVLVGACLPGLECGFTLIGVSAWWIQWCIFRVGWTVEMVCGAE
jgi:hypothetical protein